MAYQYMTAEQAAALIEDGEIIGISGLTPAGAVKVVPKAIAARAIAEHAAGHSFKIHLMTGGSNSQDVDGELSNAGALASRLPFQSNPDLRNHINAGELKYTDLHLSDITQSIRYGHLPRPRTAIVEVCEVTEDGELTFTTSESNSAGFCMSAERIILELNTYHKPELRELHDIYLPKDYPERGPIDIRRPRDRIGSQTLKVDPAKIVAVVPTHLPDSVKPFKLGTPVTEAIGRNIVGFLEDEYRKGNIPRDFPPLQSGIGNVANAVLGAIESSSVIPPICMYTEVLQDTAFRLIQSGRCKFASSSTITVTEPLLQEIYANFDFYKDKIVLRPTEISNNPEVIRRMGVISMNTAIEADVFGNVNSSHLYGNKMMNGIGGSCDFARAAGLAVLSCPSVTKNGCISSIVPMVSHVDQTEHDVDVIATEQGVADLRRLCPADRAECIIENCAHPDYKPLLRRYLAHGKANGGHTPLSLEHAFAFHRAYLETGDMRNARL